MRPSHITDRFRLRGSLALLTFGLALQGAATACADQLIQIPTADRAPGIRTEYLHRFQGPDQGYGTVVAPLGLAYELMGRYYNGLDNSHNLEIGGQLQLLPDGVVTPAVSLGVWDITNSAPWGRRGYLALTKGIERGQFGLPRPFRRAQLTLGTGTGRLSGVFAGLRLDLPANISLVTEYDARRLNLGFWISPVRSLSLKAELQNGEPFFGGELRKRF